MKYIPIIFYLKRHVMKLSLLLHLYILSIAIMCPLSYGMDAPPIHPFVMEILTLTTQCINAESSHLESWICNKQNSLIELQLKLLGGYFIEDRDITAVPISFLLGPIAPESQGIFEQIGDIEIVEKKTSYHINKPLLREFRIGIVMHNQLIEQELQSIRQSLKCSQTTYRARTENIIYARELVGISNPRLSCLLPEEQNIIQQLRGQRITFQIDKLTNSKPTIDWFMEQQKLLNNYLNIQNLYIQINPLLSDQEKNKKYEKELEKTQLAIKKYHLKIKIKRTHDCFLEFPCLIMLNKHKKYVEELQKISPSVEKEETIALISAAQEARQLAEERKQEEKQNKKAKRQRPEQIKAEQEAQQLTIIKTQQENAIPNNEQQDTKVTPQIPESTADSSADKNQIPSSTYESLSLS